ncbi:MAG: sigma-70 family RNA polymerase sigma factor [Ruminococcaceae bacterium]|nr:sigma-70 family RNA polymerase sigma factor [Oscillospiraceae bacterium]
MEDRTLVSLLDEDPEKGMSILEKSFREALYYAVSQRLRNATDIDDCVHDTLNDFYLQRRRFDPEKGTLKAYLTKMAERKAIHKFRENIRRSPSAQEDIPMGSDALDIWENRRILLDALEHLPEKYRIVVEMKYFEGYDIKEIAAIQGVNYETVKKQLQRAYKKLQEWI